MAIKWIEILATSAKMMSLAQLTTTANLKPAHSLVGQNSTNSRVDKDLDDNCFLIVG